MTSYGHISKMPCMIVVGGHYGDEGKGKIISYLCEREKPKIVARGGVGPNAGHTVVIGEKRYAIRMVPSGFATKGARILIGAGVLVNPVVLKNEIKLLSDFAIEKRLGVDKRCGVIEEKHIVEDSKNKFLNNEIRTTGSGCGPANSDRVNRILKLAKDYPELRKYLANVPSEINEAIESQRSVLIEGSQGFGLSLYYGSYPYVTSKDTSASTIAMDVGVGPTKIDEVIVVFKAYTSRVGAGPLPTKISQEQAEKMGIIEYGTVTGRRRDIGTFDFDLAKDSVMINGATQIALNCVDRLFPDAQGAREWKELPKKAQEFITKIEERLKVPVTIIGVGPERYDIIDRRDDKLP